MRLILIAAVAALAGCATTQEIAAKPAEESLVSQRPRAEITECLALKFSGAPIEAGGKSIFIVKDGYGQTSATISLADAPGGGTLVEMRRRHSLTIVGNWRGCA